MGLTPIDNIRIHDDSLDNDSNMDWFDETLDDYYNRRKTKLKMNCKTQKS